MEPRTDQPTTTKDNNMKTYVLHSVHLEGKPRDASSVSATSDSPEKLIAWLGEQFRKEREWEAEEGYDENEMTPLEMLEPTFKDVGPESVVWLVFEPKNHPYVWEISEVPVI